jgi:carbon storage regulator
MLVLSRKAGERIVIGTNIVVTVNRIKGDRVIIGVEAPMSVPIVRDDALHTYPKDMKGPKSLDLKTSIPVEPCTPQPCPDCGRPMKQDHNSVWCDYCGRLWPIIKE